MTMENSLPEPELVSVRSKLGRTRWTWRGVDLGRNEAKAYEIRSAAANDATMIRNLNTEVEQLKAAASIAEEHHTAALQAAEVKHDQLCSSSDERVKEVQGRADATEKARQQEHVDKIAAEARCATLEANLAEANTQYSELCAELDEQTRLSSSTRDGLERRINTLYKVSASERALIESQADVLGHYHAFVEHTKHRLPKIPGITADAGGLKIRGNVLDVGGNKTFKVFDAEGNEIFKTKEVAELIGHIND